MILPCNNSGWVRADDGCAAPFDVARLEASIQRAARRAGHEDWWLAESVALAIEEFIRLHAPQQTVTVSALAELVREVLVALGYPEIAAAYSRALRHAEVRLDEISDTVSELEFFRRLDKALEVIRKDDLVSVRVRGLHSCVKRLRCARYWSAGCRGLAEEILFHIRERAIRSRPAQAGQLQVWITA